MLCIYAIFSLVAFGRLCKYPAVMRIAGIILAGGQSSRMGQNKALLPYKGARLIDHIAAQFKEAEIDNLFTSGEIEGFESIPDLIKAKGPLGGICSTLIALSNFDLAIFCPTDMPLLNSKTLKLLVKGENEIVKFASEPLPFAIKLNKKTKNAAQHFLQHLKVKSLSITAFQQEFDVFEINADADIQKCLINTNSLEEWQEIMESERRE